MLATWVCYSHALLNMRLMLNQAWWTHLAINMSHRKHVRIIESFFTSNQSQTESEKNDTEDEQYINQEETDEDQRKPKNHEHSRNLAARSHMVALWKGGNVQLFLLEI